MMAIDLFYQIRRLAHLNPVVIEGWAFRLHYWVTSTGLFAASALAFAKQYFGDPIECIFDATRGNEIQAVDAYCWLHATVHLDNNLITKLNTMPRIRMPCKGFPTVARDDEGDAMQTLYYQWVPFFLLLQGLMFRLPWQLWRQLEGGKMEEFGMEARKHLMNSDSEETVAHQYATAFCTVLHRNNFYFVQYVFCEVLNMITLLAVVTLTNTFLGQQFWDYGTQVWDYYHLHSSQRSMIANPMCSLFPTVTSCQFPSGALTGNLNVDHAMCILSLNIINDKIFLLQWCWFFVLGIFTSISLLGMVMFIMFPSFRRYWIRRKARMWIEHDQEVINSVLRHCYVGDCFLLYLLSKNTNSYIYKRIVKSIAVVFRERKHAKNAFHSSPSLLTEPNGGAGGGASSTGRTGSIGGRYGGPDRPEFNNNGV